MVTRLHTANIDFNLRLSQGQHQVKLSLEKRTFHVTITLLVRYMRTINSRT